MAFNCLFICFKLVAIISSMEDTFLTMQGIK